MQAQREHVERVHRDTGSCRPLAHRRRRSGTIVPERWRAREPRPLRRRRGRVGRGIRARAPRTFPQFALELVLDRATLRDDPLVSAAAIDAHAPGRAPRPASTLRRREAGRRPARAARGKRRRSAPPAAPPRRTRSAGRASPIRWAARRVAGAGASRGEPTVVRAHALPVEARDRARAATSLARRRSSPASCASRPHERAARAAALELAPADRAVQLGELPARLLQAAGSGGDTPAWAGRAALQRDVRRGRGREVSAAHDARDPRRARRRRPPAS